MNLNDSALAEKSSDERHSAENSLLLNNLATHDGAESSVSARSLPKWNPVGSLIARSTQAANRTRSPTSLAT